MPKTTEYHVRPAILERHHNRIKGEVPPTKARELADRIDKYYIHCVNKMDLWGDPLVVAKMIEEVYGEE